MDNTLDWYTSKVLTYILYIHIPHIHINKLYQNYIFTNSSTLILIETKKHIEVNVDRDTYTVWTDEY